MSDYTHDQIALMAKLVPESFETDELFAGQYYVVDPDHSYRKWQPWSDWRDLGPLYLSCYGWWDKNYADAVTDPETWFPLVAATNTSDFDQFAAAVCNLAIEIGKVM